VNLFRTGHHEGLKTVVHGSVLGLAAVCCGYNVVSWLVRWRDGRRQDQIRHLAVNAVVYGALVGYEVIQVGRHVNQGEGQ
jgi:hypothetical protein